MTADVAKVRGLISAGLMMASIMTGLDATVAIIAMPHIQSSVAASPEQITWVVTSYMVAQAVVMPVTGWLTDRIGFKPMLLFCISGFTATSFLCAIATSLPEMVFYRMLQGVMGAPLLPLAQAVLLNINPPHRHAHAMAVWSMGNVLAPVLGPSFGGFLTESLSWRWCFYINVPVGVVSLLLVLLFMPKDETLRKRNFDFLGFGALMIGVAALQLMLDRGPSKDWFSSREIWIEATVAAGGLWIFLAHTLTAPRPLFDPAILRDRNYVVSVLNGFFFSIAVFACLTLLPQIMQGLMGYSVLVSGWYSTPRGLATLLVLSVAGRLDALVDRRLLLAIGMGIMVYSYWLMSHFDLSMTGREVAVAGAIQGFGQGLATVPMTTLGFATLNPALRAEASGFGNLIRSFGGSAGIAVMQGLAIQNTQTMHASLAEHVRLDDPVVRAGLPTWMSPATTDGAMALNAEITRQAMMVAFVNNFHLVVVLALLSFPLVFLFKNPRQGKPIETIDEAPAHAV